MKHGPYCCYTTIFVSHYVCVTNTEFGMELTGVTCWICSAYSGVRLET